MLEKQLAAIRQQKKYAPLLQYDSYTDSYEAESSISSGTQITVSMTSEEKKKTKLRKQFQKKKQRKDFYFDYLESSDTEIDIKDNS